MTYKEKLQDPRWQKKRLEILSSDNFTCQTCFDEKTTLHVHHFYYKKGVQPWEYPNHAMVTVCAKCHKIDHSELLPDDKKLWDDAFCSPNGNSYTIQIRDYLFDKIKNDKNA